MNRLESFEQIFVEIVRLFFINRLQGDRRSDLRIVSFVFLLPKKVSSYGKRIDEAVDVSLQLCSDRFRGQRILLQRQTDDRTSQSSNST